MVDVTEDFSVYSSKVVLEPGEKIKEGVLTHYNNLLINSDSLNIAISIDESEPERFTIQNIDDFNDVLSINDNIDKESIFTLKFEIIKSNISTLSIYDINAFYDHVNTLTLEEILNSLSEIFTGSDLLNFKSPSNGDYVAFASQNLGSHKSKRLDAWKISCNAQNINQFNFIPDDFNMIEYSESFSNLKIIFDKIKFLLNISFLADLSTINDNEFQFKLNGYKLIDYNLDFKNLDIKNDEELNKIYLWIYEDSHSTIDDKLGLSRNIISRHIISRENQFIIENDCFQSIISAYKIYLKDNVEKYIEVKNKVAEISAEISVKSKDVTGYIISSFKNNTLTLLTYFVSIFVFNSLSSNSELRIFNTEIYNFTMVVLLISTFYLIITIKQIRKELMINTRYFFSLKKIYKDIFDAKDLNKIFSKRHLKYNNDTVLLTAVRFSTFWLIEIFCLYGITLYLTYFV
ncbi:hypothetical protein FLK61_35340 [Paenalkalicoccus suaedae]|uniref:Uncharacterized protein n=1 Tax=Paenalkalicoccus suaedae TaxID=2592382 RepID=A0A859FH21_9BACI|nr:hypothetical protein [Paenalkalicoccus suaedae]QKS71944.1 hypothetical protein FLK61_35340 [Paenalkalicoccus suaedae]